MKGTTRLAAAHLALDALPFGVSASYALAEGVGPLFYTVELQVYRPGTAPAADRGWLARARMTPLPASLPLESTDTLRASDLGYRTAPSDLGGVVAYPPTLSTAFEIDRRINLAPGAPAAAAAWGTLRLANLGRRYDALARTRNADGRPVRLLVGRRRYDAQRGIDLDPPYAALTELFAGVATPWSLSEDTLSVPLRDATYWLERFFLSASFAGSGGLEGGADLKGRLKPRARGGSNAQPIRDVPVVWVDRVNGIAMLSDAPGAVLGLSENGDPNQILGSGTVPNILTASPAPGRYVWSSSAAGLFIRLGSPTQGTISCDVVGGFPSGAAPSTAAEIARRLLVEDLGLPADMVDQASFLGLDAAYPWVAGDHWDGGGDVDGAAAVGLFLASLGAKLIPARNRRLRAWALRPLPVGTRPLATYTAAQIVDLRPSDRLASAGLAPPPYRWRVAWGRCHSVQTSNLDPDVSATRREFLATEDRFALWSSTTITAAYRRPSDPPPVATRLLDASPALQLAAALGGQWSSGEPPRLYDLVLPLVFGLRHEIGDPIVIAYPLDDLDGGRLGQVVGEQLRSGEATITLQILVQR